MKFWVDAQLPSTLAKCLSVQFDVEAVSLRDPALRDWADSEIFKAAHQANVVIISKDGDFVDWRQQHCVDPSDYSGH